MNFEKEFRDLKRRLDREIKTVLMDVEEHHKELDEIDKVSKKYPKLNDEFMRSILRDALDEAKATIASAEKLIKASQLLKI